MTSARDTALSDLVRQRGEALVRYAYLLTGDVAAAQDLVQEALVKVFVRTRTGFQPDVLEAYVRRTIATRSIDGHRRRRRWTQVEHLFAEVEDSIGDGDTDEGIDLRAALAGLARQERTAVVLRYFEDLTVPEVARAMGLAEGSVKRYLSNATRKLERQLGPLLEAPTDAHAPVLLQTSPPGRGT